MHDDLRASKTSLLSTQPTLKIWHRHDDATHAEVRSPRIKIISYLASQLLNLFAEKVPSNEAEVTQDGGNNTQVDGWAVYGILKFTVVVKV